MKILVAGTGGSVVSGISSAADQMVRTLDGLDVEAIRLVTGGVRRRSPGGVNLQNLVAAGSDAIEVFRTARREGVDVVWNHTFGVPTLAALRAMSVAIAARLAGARAITHVHAYGIEDWLRRAGPSLRPTLRALDRASERTFVLYDRAADLLRTAGRMRSVEVFPMWVDVPDACEHRQESPGPVRIVFVGGLVRRKGIDELLDAAHRLRDGGLDFELHLVGSAAEDGPDAQRSLEAEAADLVASGHVHLRGELAPTAVRAILRTSDLFVLPSRAEGLPLAMLEAMSEGVPVIVGDAGDIRRVVEASGCGRVLAATSASVIARAIADLAADPVARSAASAAGRRAARQRAESAVRLLADVLGAEAGQVGR